MRMEDDHEEMKILPANKMIQVDSMYDAIVEKVK